MTARAVLLLFVLFRYEFIPPGSLIMIMTFQRASIVACLCAVVTTSLPDLLLGQDFPQIYNSEPNRDAEPMSPEQAVATMKLPAGFRATVFAAEPDVQNPIAMAWDAQGRMWVAENYTYAERTQRFDLNLRDRVTVLEDQDGDGRMDRRTVFTDQVQMLTSVEVGRGGVWLMCPPQLLFIPDANEDKVPDGPAQVVVDGFTVAQDNYHNFANGLRWGPDGWLYGRCGHSCPGRIGLPGTADAQRVPLDGGVWRYHPERKTVEVLCHGTTNPWGHDWDPDGELFFVNTVIGHLWHMMPGAHFKESFGESMNPDVYERIDMVADHYHFDTRGNWTESRDGKANDLGGGHAHIGMMIYQGKAWPEAYRGKLFTLNMHGRRANVERLERQGAGYVARHEPDFFIAEDPFFRGMEISVGPDDQVYVFDWSDTGECHEHTGVHRTSGRIYKLSYEAAERSRDKAASGIIKPSCLRGDGDLRSLWRDYQAGKVTTKRLQDLLQHQDEHLRVWAVRLLTDFWPLDTVVGPLARQASNETVNYDPAVIRSIIELAKRDDTGLVQSVLASTLQRLPVDWRLELASVLVTRAQYADDRDLPLLVWYGLIPVLDTDPQGVAKLASQNRWPRLSRWIARGLARRLESSPAALDQLLQDAKQFAPEHQQQIAVGMSDAFRGWRKVQAPKAWLEFSKQAAVQSQTDVVRELGSLFGDGRAMDEIRKLVMDGRTDLPTRQMALETMIDAQPDDLRAVCETLLDTRVLNATAAKGLAKFDDPAVAEQLVRKYRRFQASDRPAVIEVLVSRPSFAKVLLDALADPKEPVPKADINAFHARQIRSLNDEQLNSRLVEVWGALRDTPAERRQLLDSLKQTLTRETLAKADLSAGRTLFTKTCSQCHVLYGEGAKVGPDLTGSQRTSLDYLLENILDPSAVVGKDYRMSVVLTNDGRVINGLVVSRDAKTLVIQTQTARETLSAEDIEEVRQTTLSPMPDGMLDKFSPDQVRDLFAYLMHSTQVPPKAE